METEIDENLCQSCKKNQGTSELHPCPYAEDVHNDFSAMCNCCDECIQQCSDDI